ATLVHLTSSAQSNVFYTLTITNVEDVAGNPMPGDTTYFWGGISTIASAREDLDSDFIPDKKGDIITVEGTATVEWYIISSSACFIQDVTAGINIYTPGDDPGILRGDIARVAGEVAQYTGTTEIKNLARFEVIGQAGVPSPYTVLLSEFGEDNEGSLIRVENVYYAGGDAWPGTDSSANMLITNDTESDTATLRVYYKTDIDGSPEPSWPIDIVGIIDQYDNSAPYDSNYQILPRDMGDLTEVGIEEECHFISLNNIENPIRNNTQISFTLSKESNISLKVYNMLGQIVTELTKGKYNVGEHAIEWNTENIPTGIYFINLATGQLRKTQKAVILK
ncbi:T9SS type A sorting domain-containing protein, partial [candidate division WOR-3 bacterium]|nr:T9SS type A sorting domain-containing protein [candidate division WOR-3 bacterium]